MSKSVRQRIWDWLDWLSSAGFNKPVPWKRAEDDWVENKTLPAEETLARFQALGPEPTKGPNGSDDAPLQDRPADDKRS